MTENLSVFKKYYNNPEWRQRHLSYMKEKVTCPGCGFVTSRNNMTRHKRSRNHVNRIKQQEISNVASLENKIQKLKQKLKQYKEVESDEE